MIDLVSFPDQTRVVVTSLVPRPHPLTRRNVSRQEARAGWSRDQVVTPTQQTTGVENLLSDI